MSDTDLQTSEASVILSEANIMPSETSTIPSQAGVIPSAHPVILSEAKDLSPSEAPIDLDTLEPDLALEDELIIEDFTIDGICGVY